MSLSRNFVYNLQTFLGFCQVHFYNFVDAYDLLSQARLFLD